MSEGWVRPSSPVSSAFTHHEATVWWGRRRLFIFGCLLLALLGMASQGMSARGLWPSWQSWPVVKEMLRGALTPAWTYESGGFYAESGSFLRGLGQAMLETVRLSLAAVSLSVVGGLVLGFLGSTAWWGPRPGVMVKMIWGLARAVMTILRSVHELIWALILLAAFGLSPVTAVLAIALPYSGTLAKIFAEMTEEAPEPTKLAMTALGASPAQAFFIGLVPRVCPDLISYLLYRLECGLRSAAVMGFLGLPTLGHMMKLSFENAHYRELWSAVYALLILVITADLAGAWWRRRQRESGQPLSALNPGSVTESQLYEERPRQFGLRFAGGLVLGLVVWAWAGLIIKSSEAWTALRGENVRRFFNEITPWPLRQGEGPGAVWNWALGLWQKGAAEAVWTTAVLSLLAIVLAGAMAFLLSAGAARTLAKASVYEEKSSTALRQGGWAVLRAGVLGLITVMRAIPEYIWAFLLMMIVADVRWAAVGALALHNGGILARLGAEALENADAAVPRQLRWAGSGRWSLWLTALVPMVWSRWMVYFFYRAETCLRESTVLGLLGVATLGGLVREARAMDRYDEMMVYIVLGAVLVIGADLLSLVVRRLWR